MALTVGAQLGPYEIQAPLGAGGMGEVYRARDGELGRDVAVKILPPNFADDPDRLARFEREARVLAALNHPHIAAIYGVEEADPSTGSGQVGKALILELVDGPTLAERLRQGPLPRPEAIALARQIADALEAAHEKGIVHRDLKPANIKVTPAGTVKVLDFGLAKLTGDGTDANLTRSPTVTADATREGVLLGTAAYMSPEQARGQTVDKRTDIWAFGCVLYETLAGCAPFGGDTVSDTLAAVLEHEPDWTRLPAGTPPGIRRLLRRCLDKDARRRLRDVGDARMELEESQPGNGEAAAVERHVASRRRLWLAVAAAVLVGAAAMGLLLSMLGGRTGETRPLITRTTVMLPANQELDISGRAAPLAISPDGRRLVYVAHTAGRTQLYLRDLDAFESRPVTGTDHARYPFFSPDGQWIAFFADGLLKRVSIRGGSPVTVCEVPVPGRGGTWGPDGTIVFASATSGLVRVPAAGGTPEAITSRDPEMDARALSWPQFLPDGRALLATIDRGAGDSLAALSLTTGTWQPLVQGSQATYLPSGHVVFHARHVREGELQAFAFDVTRLAVQGEPVSVFDGVFRSEAAGGAYFAIARNGTVVYAPGGHARTLVRVDRTGRRTPLLNDRRGFRMPRTSPDGQKVAVTIDPRPSQIWVYDLARGSGVPLSTERHNLSPVWTPDGLRVAYRSGDEMHWRAADGSGEAERVPLPWPGPGGPGSWSHDGRWLLFHHARPTHLDIWVSPVGGDARPLVATLANEIEPRLSRDDRWLAYTSNESGRNEVYVRPFPNVDAGKWLASIGGGGFAVWAPASDELFYVNGTAMMSVRVETDGATFRAGTPELLFTGPFETGSPHFDISPDGTYFVMVEADPDARPTQLHVVLNWVEELKQLVTVAR